MIYQRKEMSRWFVRKAMNARKAERGSVVLLIADVLKQKKTHKHHDTRKGSEAAVEVEHKGRLDCQDKM